MTGRLSEIANALPKFYAEICLSFDLMRKKSPAAGTRFQDRCDKPVVCPPSADRQPQTRHGNLHNLSVPDLRG